MMVTARSTPTLLGRQICSSTPRAFTPASRCGSPVRAFASTSMAFQAVCQSTLKWRASAETVVSSWAKASVAHPTARTVSTARGGAMSLVSLNTPIGQRRLPAAPHPFQPPHHRDPAQTGRIMQHPGTAAVAGRNHPAQRAAGFDLIRLHRYDQPAVTIIFNIEHVHAGNTKDRIGSGAPARTRATHRVDHRRVLRGTGAWSPLILKVPTPLLGHQHAQPDTVHHRQFRRPGNRR